jgi:hypothetical protein
MKKLFETNTFNIKKSVYSNDKRKFSLTSTKTEANQNLTHIRNRKSDPDLKIDTETAGKIVKDYILPMFKLDFREKSHNKRLEQMGLKTHKRNFSDTKGTLYGEMKLSESLSNEIGILSKDLTDTRHKLKESQQKLYEIQYELDLSNQNNRKNELTIKFLLENIRELKKKTDNQIFSQALMAKQIYSYKAINTELLNDNQNLSQALENQKASNDIRFISCIP